MKVHRLLGIGLFLERFRVLDLLLSEGMELILLVATVRLMVRGRRIGVFSSRLIGRLDCSRRSLDLLLDGLIFQLGL